MLVIRMLAACTYNTIGNAKVGGIDERDRRQGSLCGIFL
jgi:hypothetical protein